jgi:UDP-N-acetylglucosamine/UDP-N-acetylgalactosamine diphosphorylase
MSASNYQDIKSYLEKHDQSHLLTFYDSLSETERQSLLTQIASIDVPRVNRIFQTAVQSEREEKAKASNSNDDDDQITPLPEKDTASLVDEASKPLKEKWYQTGLSAIKSGQAGLILMAGGQGTRLGSSAPKGCYDISLPSHKSLFQMQGERIKKLNELAGTKKGGKVVWYVMTSGPTREETEKYFKENEYFGLDQEDVVFFNQGKP